MNSCIKQQLLGCELSFIQELDCLVAPHISIKQTLFLLIIKLLVQSLHFVGTCIHLLPCAQAEMAEFTDTFQVRIGQVGNSKPTNPRLPTSSGILRQLCMESSTPSTSNKTSVALPFGSLAALCFNYGTPKVSIQFLCLKGPDFELGELETYLGVAKNRGTPKSSILVWFSIINTPIFGNTHLRHTKAISTGLLPQTAACEGIDDHVTL